MNVFSTLENLKYPIKLTQKNYNDETHRVPPYVINDGSTIHYYALCPECGNPVTLVNRNVSATSSQTLYAKHTGRSIQGLAQHDQAAYEDCPLHNPEKFDSDVVRKSGVKNAEILNAIKHHLHLIVFVLEKATGIKLTDDLIEKMLMDFKTNDRHKFKSVTLYNLPFGFVYLTEARDLWGVRVDDELAEAINKGSRGFEVGEKSKVGRKKGLKGTQIRFYFNNHRLGSEAYASDRIDFLVAEISDSKKESKVLYKKSLDYDSAFFVNTYLRRERLRLLAFKHL